MRPWVCEFNTNIGALLIISTIAFGWMLFFNTISVKLYGDHCVYDSDCALDMNYICQNGVCGCTSTTYYKSAREGCGNTNYKFIIEIFLRMNELGFIKILQLYECFFFIKI